MKQSSLNEQEQMLMEMESRQQNLIKQTSMSESERMLLDMESKEEDGEEEITEVYRSTENGIETVATITYVGAEQGDNFNIPPTRILTRISSERVPEPPKPDGGCCLFHGTAARILFFIATRPKSIVCMCVNLFYSFAITMGAESTTKRYRSIFI